jgi:hypothetical protein
MKIAMRITTYWMYLMGLNLIFSCQKQDDYAPNDGKVAYVNFYNAADGLIQNGAISGRHRIYIKDTIATGLTPEFSTTDDARQYPRSVTGSDLAVDYLGVPNDVTYNVVYWLPLKTGSYHFGYTSVSNDNVLKRTIANNSIDLKSDSFTTQYLVESLQSDTSYQILNVPVERKGVSGKVRIQVLNLSPDLGALEVFREDSNGTKIDEGLPAALASGTYSDYTAIDTAGAQKNLGQLLIKIRKIGSTGALFTASVPAVSKSSFIIVVQGFASQTTRRINSIQGSTIGFVKVSVAPNLRINLRRTY